MRLRPMILSPLAAACVHAAGGGVAVERRGLEVGRVALTDDQAGCARRVGFDLVELDGGARAPATLCLAGLPDGPDGAWFWLDGTLTVAWPDGHAVFRHRIRAADVDPTGAGRPMRVALWRGTLDGAASDGRYAGARGSLRGGGVLVFDAPIQARPELVLALELAPGGRRASTTAGPPVLIFDDARFGPGHDDCRVDVAVGVHTLDGAPAPRARFCTRAIDDTGAAGWFAIRGPLRLTWPDGELVIDLRSYESRDPDDPDHRRDVVWDGAIDPVASTGRFHGRGGTLRGGGTFAADGDDHAVLEIHTRLDLATTALQ